MVKRLNQMGYVASTDSILQEDGFCETFLSQIGWPPMENADFMDAEGADYVFDLAEPPPDALNGKFDLVYDGGTTEHVFDIAQALRNADAMLKEGGVFVSNVGADGWYGHGFYQMGPDVPWRFWVASLGYEMLECVTYNRRDSKLPEPVADPTDNFRGGWRTFDSPQFIFYAVRKMPRPDGPKPVVQSHYVKHTL